MDDSKVRIAIVLAIFTTIFITVAIAEYVKNTTNTFTPSSSIYLGSKIYQIDKNFPMNTNQYQSITVHNPIDKTLNITFSILTNPQELAQYVTISSNPQNITYIIAPYQSGSAPFVFSISNKTTISSATITVFAMGYPA